MDGDVGGTHTKGNGEIDGNGASSAGETPLNESGSDGVAPSAVSSQAVPDTALPIILGHSLERHIKICRCKHSSKALQAGLPTSNNH